MFFSSSSSSSPPPLSEKRERFHRVNFTAGQKAVRGRGIFSRDESRRVFEKAALLSEGGMAMEYRLPFQEGRTRWRGARMDVWIDLVHMGSVACPFLHRLFFFSLLWNSFSRRFRRLLPAPNVFRPSSHPPSLSPSLFLRWLI